MQDELSDCNPKVEAVVNHVKSTLKCLGRHEKWLAMQQKDLDCCLVVLVQPNVELNYIIRVAPTRMNIGISLCPLTRHEDSDTSLQAAFAIFMEDWVTAALMLHTVATTSSTTCVVLAHTQPATVPCVMLSSSRGVVRCYLWWCQWW